SSCACSRFLRLACRASPASPPHSPRWGALLLTALRSVAWLRHPAGAVAMLDRRPGRPSPGACTRVGGGMARPTAGPLRLAPLLGWLRNRRQAGSLASRPAPCAALRVARRLASLDTRLPTVAARRKEGGKTKLYRASRSTAAPPRSASVTSGHREESPGEPRRALAVTYPAGKARSQELFE